MIEKFKIMFFLLFYQNLHTVNPHPKAHGIFRILPYELHA
jgi:hypothetical protein